MGFRFWGHYQHSLDSKNRVAIPARFRQQLPDGKVVVTKMFDGCLVVYPESEWEKLLQTELSDLNPITSSEGRRIERTLFGSAFPCEIDKQGRISLSAYHLSQAGIEKEVIFKGLNNKFEIWDKKRWEEWEEEDQRASQEV